ncbi:MAG: accessory factor UbiK family protein [Pseudomonadales bacterium]|nr:accessory factor UbiK family protein [Pseudomonadales bacterium]
MIDNSLLNDLSKRLSALIPAASGLRDELRTKIEQTVKATFQEFDLLTREEFESQAQALQRAETRIAELESLINELEKRLDKNEV